MRKIICILDVCVLDVLSGGATPACEDRFWWHRINGENIVAPKRGTAMRQKPSTPQLLIRSLRLSTELQKTKRLSLNKIIIFPPTSRTSNNLDKHNFSKIIAPNNNSHRACINNLNKKKFSRLMLSPLDPLLSGIRYYYYHIRLVGRYRAVVCKMKVQKGTRSINEKFSVGLQIV